MLMTGCWVSRARVLRGTVLVETSRNGEVLDMGATSWIRTTRLSVADSRSDDDFGTAEARHRPWDDGPDDGCAANATDRVSPGRVSPWLALHVRCGRRADSWPPCGPIGSGRSDVGRPPPSRSP